MKRQSIGAIAGLAVVLAIVMGCTNPSATATSGAGGQGGPPAGGTAVTISNFAFDPASITVKPGTTVTWTNKDSVAHTVSADDSSWGGQVGPGQTFSHTFAAAGSFPYHCEIHPNMHGTVVVAP